VSEAGAAPTVAGADEPLIVVRPAPVPEGAEGDAPAVPAIEVGAGEIVVLTGPPGGGKSALLRAAAGLARFPAGRPLIAGHDLGAMSHRRRRHVVTALRLLYLPEEPVLISNLTVLENLLLPIRYFRERTEDDALREALVLLDASGLGWSAGSLPGRLSLENRRTVALLRGFLRRPAVALLDEPFLGLDEESFAGVRPLLRAAVRHGRCAVLAAARDTVPFVEMGARPAFMGARSHPAAPGRRGAP